MNFLGDLLPLPLKNLYSHLWVDHVYISRCLDGPHMNHMLCLCNLDHNVLGLPFAVFCFLYLSLILLQHSHQSFLLGKVFSDEFSDRLVLLSCLYFNLFFQLIELSLVPSLVDYIRHPTCETVFLFLYLSSSLELFYLLLEILNL